MKINFNSFSLGLGGGNRLIFELSNTLVDKGHKVTITHAGIPSLHNWYSPIKAKLIECNIGIPMRFLNKYGIRKINIHSQREKNMKKHIPDCDINIATYYDTVRPTLLSKKGIPFYLVQHYEPLFFPENSPEWIEARGTYKLPLSRLCVSHWLTEKVNGQYIGNGINLNKFKHQNLERTYDVMVIPRKLSWKGEYDLLIGQLKFHGFKVLVVNNLSDDELVKAYNSSKIFIFLSEKEGFGYPPLEAMACGCVVISTNCTEYLTDKNAFILPQKYLFSDIISKIGWLLKHKNYHTSIINEGFITAKQYNFDNVVKRFEWEMEKHKSGFTRTFY